jgi:REG-2-like HAD superfamily hydrolase
VLPLVLQSGTALWVDAAGTLLHPTRSVATVYAESAGVSVEFVKARFGPAMKRHRALRRGDPTWSAFWKAVVAESTGDDSPECMAKIFDHFDRPDAWRVADGGRECLATLRARGVRVALISNWDTRLRKTLEQLDLLGAFDTVLISGEEGVEKPDAEIFMRAAERLNVPAERSLMVGDDPVSDVLGARSVGAFVMQFGTEIKAFSDIMDS